MSMLDGVFGILRTIASGGSAVPSRATLDFTDGLQAIDDADNGKTLISLRADTRTALVNALTAGAYDGEKRHCDGYYARGDGGGGLFVWDEDNVDTAVPGMVIGTGTGRWLRVFEGPVNVRWFGAKGDAVADDTSAIQAAIDYHTGRSGGQVFIPTGLYRVTSTLHVGLPEYASLSWLTGRTDAIDDSEIVANRDTDNRAVNLYLPHVDIMGSAGAMIVADWAPATPEPVISYNIGHYAQGQAGSISNLTISCAANIVDGAYDESAVTTNQHNKLIGVFDNYSGARAITTVRTNGLEHGLLTLAGYMVNVENFEAWFSGVAVNLCSANAMTVTNLSIWYADKGLMFDGDASSVRGLHTEQAAQDITIFSSDCCEFGPAYLEDVLEDDGAGTYAVKLGTAADTIKVKHTKFSGIRVGTIRPNKKAFRFYGCAGIVLDRCRDYSYGSDSDTTSYGTVMQGDFDVPSAVRNNFTRLSSGITVSSNQPSGTGMVTQGPWVFGVSGISLGVIAANDTAVYEYSLPSDLDSLSNAAAHFSFTSGGSDALGVSTRILFSTPKKVRVSFTNATSSSIDPGTINGTLIVFASL